jgi:hypothetical protein
MLLKCFNDSISGSPVNYFIVVKGLFYYICSVRYFSSSYECLFFNVVI